MQQKLRNKIGLMTSILFLLITFVPCLFAAEYIHIYRFEAPKIVTLPNGRQILKMKDTWQQDDIVGAPILPVKTAKIFIPATEKIVSVVITRGKLKTIEGSYLIQHATTPYPISYKGPVTIDKPDPNIYETDTLYPSAVHRTRKPQFLSGAKIALVDLKPVLYNPVEAQLKYYDKMKVMIRTEKQKRPDWVMPFRNLPKDREKILRTIENKDDFLKLHPSSGQSKTASTESLSEEPSPVEGSREYVVITTAELLEAFQTLTTYRASAQGGGYTTYIEAIANINNYPGVDLAEKMRNFIRDMYDIYGTQYVVLGGDCDGSPGSQVIPTRGCYAQVGSTTDENIPSDLYFGCLDGSWNSNGNEYWGESDDGVDWESEVYVGRIAADNDTEARNQIDKIIAFETGNRPDKTLLVGEKLDGTPTWGGNRMDWVYTYMDSIPKTELYDRDWENNSWPKSQLLSFINSDEHHWINHLGHSNVTNNMKLYNSDVALMTNTNYLLVYSQGCYSGSMDSRYSSGSYGGTDCFGETITDAYNDRGAFAYIGNSRYGWYNPGSYVAGASNLAHKEFVEAVFTGNITKLGEANQKSKTDLNLDSGTYRWIAFETNLLGCPATDLRPVVCSFDTDCDDGIYCNGAETCVSGVCQYGTPVVCDDGRFCNGVEICDEDTDTCTSPGNPCVQGTICDEDTDSCDLLGCGDGVCNEGENCDTCPGDCISGQGGTCEACFKSVCNGECNPKKEGPDCADCAPSYCCGDGFCEGAEDNSNCEIDCPTAFCGDGVCEGEETIQDCPVDCGCKSNDDCDDGDSCTTDECNSGMGECSSTWPDCGLSDGCCGPDCIPKNDPDCCLPKGSKCDTDSECCNGKCRGGKCR